MASQLSHLEKRVEPSGDWRAELRSAVRDPVELCRRLDLSVECTAAAQRAAALFPIVVPESYLRRIGKGDPHDPLLRQVLPLDDEFISADGFSPDPVGDADAKVVSGLLQKYQGRALLITTGACAIHCRYCFRRHYPYAETPPSWHSWETMLDAVAEDETIHEVILSGGDPLTIVDAQLSSLAGRISEIEHVRRLRVHSRLPIVIPKRVNEELIDWLNGTRLTPIMVVHANHPAEIDLSVADAITKLVDAGILVLNQAVLLGGVNDQPETLTELCERLVDLRVIPYYLHQLDRVVGASHFEVPLKRGGELISVIQGQLPGYGVPRYVLERAGSKSKVSIS